MMGGIDRFASPWAFVLAVALPVVLWLLLRRGRGGTASIGFPAAARAAAAGASWRIRFRWLPAALRLVCMGFAILALARPQKLIGQTRQSTKGIAIQVVMDRSGSMGEAMMFDGHEATRMEVVKQVLAQFVSGDGKELGGREGDLIGLISFARFADTVCPLVHAHDALLEMAAQTREVTNRAEDGTAIGDALALGAARLKQAEDDITRRSEAAGAKAGKPDFVIKSKIMILLTDGASNAGDITPEQAAQLAAQWGIKIYAIGIGAGEGFQVIRTPFGNQRIPTANAGDEETLRAIAEATGGRYWPADDAASLRGVYAAIDRLEKTEVESLESTNADELYAVPAMAAAGVLVAEVLLSTLLFRRVP